MPSEEKPRQSPFNVRLAGEEDLDACVELALQIPKENEWDYFPKPSRKKVHARLSSLIEDRTLLVYVNNDIIVGVLGLIIDSFWWTEEETMLDVLFYIKKEFRSYKAFSRMLSVAEEFAKINGLPLSLLFFTTKDVERKYKMLRKRDYQPIGFWVTKKRQ
jgi:hypothetical protein